MFDRIIGSTHIPLKIEQYEQWINTKEFGEMVVLTHLLLSGPYSDYLKYKQFLILNSKYATIAHVLKQCQRIYLITSLYEHEYYLTPTDFQPFFKLLNWKNNLIELKYIPNVVLDYYMTIDTELDLINLLTFLTKYQHPDLSAIITSQIPHNDIIDFFKQYKYTLDESSINYVKNKTKEPLINFDLSNLFVFKREE